MQEGKEAALLAQPQLVVLQVKQADVAQQSAVAPVELRRSQEGKEADLLAQPQQVVVQVSEALRQVARERVQVSPCQQQAQQAHETAMGSQKPSSVRCKQWTHLRPAGGRSCIER